MTAAPIAPVWEGEPYERSVPVLTFALHGLPISQGSKAYKGHRRGKPVLVESAKGLKPWRGMLQTAIARAMLQWSDAPPHGFPLLGPLAVDLCFTMRRPVSAPKNRRTWPIVYPDLDKLCRAVFDVGKLIQPTPLWHDDSQVVDLRAWKVYPSETRRALTQPGLAAAVYLIDPPRVAGGEQRALL